MAYFFSFLEPIQKFKLEIFKRTCGLISLEKNHLLNLKIQKRKELDMKNNVTACVKILLDSHR